MMIVFIGFNILFSKSTATVLVLPMEVEFLGYREEKNFLKLSRDDRDL